MVPVGEIPQSSPVWPRVGLTDFIRQRFVQLFVRGELLPDSPQLLHSSLVLDLARPVK